MCIFFFLTGVVAVAVASSLLVMKDQVLTLQSQRLWKHNNVHHFRENIDQADRQVGERQGSSHAGCSEVKSEIVTLPQ